MEYTMSKTYVIHHRDSDGYCAALAHYVLGQQAQYIDVQYGEPFPQIELDDQTTVYILDFSYARVVLDDVYGKVKKLQVIDHHKTAQKQLEGAPYAIYDMSKSGSDLAWEYFHGHVPMNWLLELVTDYDLGIRKYKECFWVENTMVVHPRRGDLRYWKKLMDDPVELQEVLEIGKGIQFNNDQTLATIVKDKAYLEIEIDGLKGAAMNSSILRNEIAYAILDVRRDLDFVVTYRVKSDGVSRFAFRARREEEHVDISVFAARYGGGGHRASATATVPFKVAMEILNGWYNT